MLESEGLMRKISGSVSSNAVAWPGDKKGSSSFLDGQLKTQTQDHNFSVAALEKLCRIKIVRQRPKGNKWNLYFVTRSCPLSDFSLFILDLKLKLRSK